MEKTEMISHLTEREAKLREELISLERQFNEKKEEYLKIQGALEVLKNISS
jgi:hypothetical protein